MRLLLILVCFGISALGGNARACSVTEDYSWPSNYALVESAAAIVVATPESDEGDVLSFRILSAIKGQPPAIVSMAYAKIGPIEPSDPNSIDRAHEESTYGGCNRYTFARDGQYVLFLRQMAGEWHVMGEPFARVSEDYAGPDSLWMRAINLYLDVQRNADRMAALEDLWRLMGALERSGLAGDKAIADDILRHFHSEGDEKPTAFLTAWWEAAERGEPLLFPLSGSDQDRMTIQTVYPDLHPDNDRALLSLVNGDHPDAAPFFERLVTESPTPRQLGLAVRFFAKNGQYRRAFELVETDVVRRLGGLTNEGAFQLANDVNRALNGPYWQEEEQRELWRSDSYVFSRWPELALSISSDLKRRGGEGYIGPVHLLLTDDPRVRPEVTLLLAEGYNKALEAWAIAEVDRLTPTADWLEHDDPLWLPVRVLVVGFGEERDAALVRTFCQNESGRIIVLTSLALWGDDLKQELLMQFLAMPGLDDETVEYVRRALLILDGRTTPARNGLLGHSEAYDAVVASLAGQPAKMFDRMVAPITCPAA